MFHLCQIITQNRSSYKHKFEKQRFVFLRLERFIRVVQSYEQMFQKAVDCKRVFVLF